MDAPEQPSVARRVAAVIALLLLAAAAVTTAVALVRSELWRLIVAVAAVVLSIVSLWYGMSKRGLLRAIGLVVAGAGLALAVAIALAGAHHLALLVLALVLALLSGAAARWALRQSPESPGRDLAITSVPPAPSPVLFMNPRSGGGKVEQSHLVEHCRERGIDPVVLGPGDDLRRLTEDATARGAGALGAAGGDGSQATVASVAARHGLPFVCVPAGTRNHFALDLGLDRQDVIGALDAFGEAVERTIDLAQVNERVFVNNATLGAYATIVQSPNYRDAKIKTTSEALPDIFGDGAVPLDLRFTGPDGSRHTTAHVVLVSNNPYQLHQLRGRGTRPRIDTGLLGVVAVTLRNAGEAASFAALEAAGRANAFPGWLEWTARSFVIESGRPVEIAIDGEALTMEPPLVFESLPGVLRVRLPRRSRARQTDVRPIPDRSTVRELLATVAGHPGTGSGQVAPPPQ